jgi:L-amino acid N-acyltransferase YncA
MRMGTAIEQNSPARVAFELRVGTPADRSALLEMYESFEPKASAMGLPPRYGIQQWLESLQKFTNLLIWADHQVVGHGILCPQDDSAEVAVFIHQDFRSRGLGKLLLSELVKEARRMGLRRVWGITELDNVPMLRLARSLGFVSGDDPREFYLDLENQEGKTSSELPAA